MSDTTDKPLTLDELTKPGPESTDPAYLAWKEREIRAAIKEADENPDDFVTLDQIRKHFGLDH